jgi:hypothetical protein
LGEEAEREAFARSMLQLVLTVDTPHALLLADSNLVFHTLPEASADARAEGVRVWSRFPLPTDASGEGGVDLVMYRGEEGFIGRGDTM